MRLQRGDIVRHFKGKYYKILEFAKHSETMEDMVVYQALYAPFGVWVRPMAMFMEETDTKKYPQATQKFRFEKCEP